MQYHNDPYIDIHYNRKLHSIINEKNVVGASASALRTIDYIPSDSNTIYLSKSGSDGNTGTSAGHVKTFERALALLTVTRGKILICDSETYNIYATVLPSTCTGIYAQVLCTPVLNAKFSGVCIENKIIKATSATFTSGFSNEILSNAGCPASPPASSYDNNFSHKIVGASGRIGSYIVNVHRRHIVFCDDDGIVIWTTEVFPESDYTVNGMVSSGHCYTALGASVVPIKSRNEFFVAVSYGYLVYSASAGISVNYSSFTKLYKVNYDGATLIDTITHGTSQENSNGTGSTCPRPFRSPRSCGMLSDGTIFVDVMLYNASSVVSSAQRIYQYSNGAYSLLQTLSIPFTDATRPVMYGIKDGYIINNAISQGGLKVYNQSGTYIKTVSFALTTFDVLDIIPTRTGFFIAGRGADGLYVASISSSGDIIFDTTKVANESARANVLSLTGVQLCDRQDYVSAIYYDTGSSGKIVCVAENGKSVCNYAVDRCCQVTISDSDDGDIVAAYSTTLKNEINRIRFSWTIFDHSSPLIINGLTIQPENNYNCCLGVYSRDSIMAKNNSFINVRAANETNFTFVSYSIYSPVSGKNVTILNNVSKRCGGGFCANDPNAIIKNNQVYRHTHSYGIVINGKTAATVVDIQHNDICYGVGGIKLPDNIDTSASRIIIKNNIIHKNILGAVSATAQINIDYNLYTGILTNVVSGNHNIATDPFYRNEGYANVDETDLSLSSKVLGDSIDSIGLQCGDDGLNMGALDVEYIYVEPTWTVARFLKQYIDIQYEPVGGYINQKKSGKATAKKDATIKSVTIHGDGTPNEESDHYRAMCALCDNLTARIYFDPITFTNEFEEFLIDPTTTLKASPGFWRLSRSGTEGASLRFIRPYVEE